MTTNASKICRQKQGESERIDGEYYKFNRDDLLGAKLNFEGTAMAYAIPTQSSSQEISPTDAGARSIPPPPPAGDIGAVA